MKSGRENQGISREPNDSKKEDPWEEAFRPARDHECNTAGNKRPHPKEIKRQRSPISDRVRFLLNYDPWSKGSQPEFVK